MENREIAKILYDVADYLEMDDVPFKPYAYRKVAMSLESLETSAKEIYEKGGVSALKKIPAVGEGIAKAIEECLKTGTIRIYKEYKKKIPVDLDNLNRVEGIGVKKIKVLYNNLGVKNLKDLESAARKHKIAPLFGFGEKTEKNILEAMAFLKRDKGRFWLGDILPIAKEIIAELSGLKEVEKISIAGSTRRMKETIGDVDILAVSKNSKKVMDFFTSLPSVKKIWSKGTTKSSVRMAQGFDADLRIVPGKSYGSALQYFTGSKEHNIATRMIAIKKGLKLNEYGVLRGAKIIAGKSEEEVYKVLGLNWIPPELRENNGEIQVSMDNGLPKLVEYKDIKGDLHCHSNWDGGINSIEDMAMSAQRMGYEYIGISDHTKFLRIENGLDGKQLLQQQKEIMKLNKKLCALGSKFRILHGCEANILADGSVDVKDDVLEKLDYVIAGVHSQLKMPKDKMTERIIKAMKNQNIDIISHPTGRIVNKRDEYQVDFDKILKAAKETRTVLEINSSERMDLRDSYIKRAKEAGVKMVINTDAHRKEQLGNMEFGIAQARRGWAEKKDVINAQSLSILLKYLN
jgi:DNA polymerase (family X)